MSRPSSPELKIDTTSILPATPESENKSSGVLSRRQRRMKEQSEKVKNQWPSEEWPNKYYTTDYYEKKKIDLSVIVSLNDCHLRDNGELKFYDDGRPIMVKKSPAGQALQSLLCNGHAADMETYREEKENSANPERVRCYLTTYNIHKQIISTIGKFIVAAVEFTDDSRSLKMGNFELIVQKYKNKLENDIPNPYRSYALNILSTHAKNFRFDISAFKEKSANLAELMKNVSINKLGFHKSNPESDVSVGIVPEQSVTPINKRPDTPIPMQDFTPIADMV